MASRNYVEILGRLGQDPETRYVGADNSAVCNFSVATTEAWGKGDERQERTTWHDVVAWGRLAELCAQYLGKGRLVLVVGSLQKRQFDDKQGNKRTAVEIKASDVQFLDSAKKDGASQVAGNGPSRREDSSTADTPPDRRSSPVKPVGVSEEAMPEWDASDAPF